MHKRQKYGRFYDETKHFRTLHVTRLPTYSTEIAITNYFSTWGPVERVYIPKNIQSDSISGYCFVIFSNVDTLEEVQKKRPHRIDGTEVFTRRALPKTENSAEGKACVQVLYFKTPVERSPTKEDILEYFQQYGHIVSGPLVTENNHEKTIFIEFNDYDPVDKLFLKESNSIGNYSFKISKLITDDMTKLYKLIKPGTVGVKPDFPHVKQNGSYFVNIEPSAPPMMNPSNIDYYGAQAEQSYPYNPHINSNTPNPEAASMPEDEEEEEGQRCSKRQCGWTIVIVVILLLILGAGQQQNNNKT